MSESLDIFVVDVVFLQYLTSLGVQAFAKHNALAATQPSRSAFLSMYQNFLHIPNRISTDSHICHAF